MTQCCQLRIPIAVEIFSGSQVKSNQSLNLQNCWVDTCETAVDVPRPFYHIFIVLQQCGHIKTFHLFTSSTLALCCLLPSRIPCTTGFGRVLCLVTWANHLRFHGNRPVLIKKPIKIIEKISFTVQARGYFVLQQTDTIHCCSTPSHNF